MVKLWGWYMVVVMWTGRGETMGLVYGGGDGGTGAIRHAYVHSCMSA